MTATPEPARPSEPKLATRVEAAMDKKIILLVEAEILIRHPLAEYLRGCGYRVVEAVDAGEAQLVLEEGELEIDVVLLDISEPSGKSFALAAWIQGNLPQLDVLRAGTVAKIVDRATDLCDQQPDVPRPYDHKFVDDRIRRLLAERERRRQEGGQLVREAQTKAISRRPPGMRMARRFGN
jgi:DNA-binding NtrC family response regulator